MISDMLLDGDGGYRMDTQFDGSQVHLDLNEPVPVHLMYSWLLVGLLHQQHTCWVDPGRYRSWSLPICRLLQRHPHRLSNPTSQQHVGGPAELHVVEAAAPEAICPADLMPEILAEFQTSTGKWTGSYQVIKSE
ncbi:hypothetical protein PIB30_058236 [Stylosanthes scabra]|uniref:Uncharacterized protein n=1 Tax=Stylosanthes scabra TaxID=79078 RepID=A0ABU6VIC9_9FABA|nr:hypothetical protein [Stylosanthes scabra]